MLITEEDKNKTIAIATYLRDSEIPYGEIKCWYEKASIIFYISNGLSKETSREMAKLMVKELEKNSSILSI